MYVDFLKNTQLHQETVKKPQIYQFIM